MLFGEFEEIFASLRAHLERRGATSFLDAIREWIVELATAQELDLDRESTRRAVIDASEELLAFERRVFARLEGLIAVAVADELGQTPADLHPRLIAAAAAATLGVLRPATGTPRADADDPLAPVDDVLTFLRSETNALQSR